MGIVAEAVGAAPLVGGGETALHSHAGGGASPVTVKQLAGDHGATTIALTKVTAFDQAVGVGTWAFNYLIRHQAPALTTGIRLSVNHSGTVTVFVAVLRWTDLSASASTAVPKQNNVQAAGAVTGAFSARAPSALGWGTTLSVDVVNADMLTIIEGLLVVTVPGNLELWHGSEVAATTTVKAGSALILTKIA